MSLIKRQEKGSKITIQEMNNNLEYLEDLGVVSITKINENLIFEKTNNNISLPIILKSEDKDSYVKKIEIKDGKNIYKGILYSSNDLKIPLKYNVDTNNMLPIQFDDSKSYNLIGNLGYWNGAKYDRLSFSIKIEKNHNYDITKTFIIGTGFSTGVVNNYNLLNDGKFIIKTLNNSNYNGFNLGSITKINSDGSLDRDFLVNLNELSFFRTQNDGKIICYLTNNIIRLNSDGSLESYIDTFFNSITSTTKFLYTITVQLDGKFLIGGFFVSTNNTCIARLNYDGSIDESFISKANSYVNEIVVQSNDKIVIVGSFTSYNGVSSNRIARLNSDGSIDTSFVVGTGFNTYANSIVIQDDGKILVGGGFTSYNGVSSNRIARLNSDGSIDTSFVVGTGINTYANSIVIQDDGKILLGGAFTSYNGVSANRIIRLNTDGSIDTSFNIGTGFSSTVDSIVVQSDGKILVGGQFTSYNGVSANRIIRLNTDGSSDTQNYGELITTTSYFDISDINLLDTNLIEITKENNELVLNLNISTQKYMIDFKLIEY